MSRVPALIGETPFAVVDVETTGFSPLRGDRIVEVAVVRLFGDSTEEYVTLVNPLRDVGPVHIHGLTAADVSEAPMFTEIVGDLLGVLEGAVMVAHNLRFDRDFTQDLPDELGTFAGLVHAPDGSGAKLAAIVVCHAGDPAQAEIDLKTLVDFGSPVLSQVGPMPYPVINSMFDEGYPRGALNYWKTSFIRGLDDDVIDGVIERFASCPSPMTAIAFEDFHGAVTRVPVDATAVPHREPGYDLLITSVWTDPATTDANIAWTRSTFETLERSFAGRRYVNYLDDDDPADDAFGSNQQRLAEVKRAYDPDNMFRSTHHIAPA